MATKTYRQLTLDERETISLGLAQGRTLREMAGELGRAPSTLSRECRRNRSATWGLYRAGQAQMRAEQRARNCRRRCKLAHPGLWEEVVGGLRRGWSPEQIAARLKRAYPHDMTRQVSHETIYQALYVLPRGELRRELIACLRQGRKHRHRRSRGEDRRGQLSNLTSIHQRPAEVEGRLVPGHWEGDLLKGSRDPVAVGTLVERCTRLVLLVRLADSTAQVACAGFARKFSRVPAVMRRSLTYDRGKEMAHHERLAARVKIRVYFADPHSPWQRGTNENTNGLLRQYLPKGADLSKVTAHDLNRIAWLLNTRPRKTLGWDTPLEAYKKLTGVALKT